MIYGVAPAQENDMLQALRETVEAVVEKHWPEIDRLIEKRINEQIAEFLALRAGKVSVQ